MGSIATCMDQYGDQRKECGTELFPWWLHAYVWDNLNGAVGGALPAETGSEKWWEVNEKSTWFETGGNKKQIA
jgi:hypothetical protein